MGWSTGYGLNFRSTAGFVTDGTDEYPIIASRAYPYTPVAGLTVGWSATPTAANGSASVDRRLAGCAVVSASGPYFRIDLPEAGKYRIRAAFGRTDFTAKVNWELRDGAITVLKAWSHGATTVAQDNYVDATDATLSEAAWPSGNAEFEFTTSGADLRLYTTNTNSVLTHLFIREITTPVAEFTVAPDTVTQNSGTITLTLTGTNTTWSSGSTVTVTNDLTGDTSVTKGTWTRIGDESATLTVTVGAGTGTYKITVDGVDSPALTVQAELTVVVLVGDSITNSFGATAGQEYHTVLQAHLGSNYVVYERANNGTTLVNMQSGLSTNVIPYLTGGSRYVVLVMGGTNDLGLDGVDAATLHTRRLSLFAALRAQCPAGTYLFDRTVLPSTQSTFNARRNSENALTYADWPEWCDGLIDDGGDAVFGSDASAADGTYYQDGTHPTTLTYGYMGRQDATALRSLLYQIEVRESLAVYPAETDVRSGTDYGPLGDDYTGTCAVPAASNVLNGVSVGATTGTVVLPSAGTVLTGVSFGAGSGSTGTLTLPSAGQVRSGSGTYGNPGSPVTPTLTLPTAAQVLTGVTFGVGGTGSTGTVVLPSAGDVRLGTTYGASSGTTGTLDPGGGPADYPAESDVRAGVDYADGDLTGTLDVSGGTYPGTGDVRLGTSYGPDDDDFTGTLVVPTAAQVLGGVPVDGSTGTVVLPSAGDVRSGVTFGPSSGTTGTLDTSGEFPTTGDIAAAVWGLSTSGHTTSGTFGATAVLQTGDTYARLGAPATTTVSADIATRLAAANYTAPLTAGGTRAAVGLAAADLDTQLSTKPTLAQILAGGDVDGFSVEQTLKLCLAVLAGKLSGADGSTQTFRAADDSRARVIASVSSSGRVSITLDAAG